jgi:hypothetical protein
VSCIHRPGQVVGDHERSVTHGRATVTSHKTVCEHPEFGRSSRSIPFLSFPALASTVRVVPTSHR